MSAYGPQLTFARAALVHFRKGSGHPALPILECRLIRYAVLGCGEGNEATRLYYANGCCVSVPVRSACTIDAHDRRAQLARAWRVFPSLGSLSSRTERERFYRGSER